MARFAKHIVAFALVACSVAHADPNVHVEWHRDTAVIDGGVIVWATFYTSSVAIAAVSDATCNGCTDHAYDLLYLPLVGPAIAAALPGVLRAGIGWSVVLIADSTVQVGAALVALVAYAIPTKRTAVRTDLAWSVTPGAHGAPLGLTFTVSAF